MATFEVRVIRAQATISQGLDRRICLVASSFTKCKFRQEGEPGPRGTRTETACVALPDLVLE